MGALDKKIFSGVAIVSALLFVVSAVMLLANGGDIAADDNGTALYILIVSGLLTVVFGAALVMDRSSFVRTLSGGLAALTGILFLAVPFAGGSTGTLLAVASIVAAVTIIADMLALWVSRVYGAMYVAAVLAAVEIAMGIMYFVGSTQVTYHAIALIVFGVWLALSAYVFGFVKVESSVRTREVKEDLQTQRGERPQAKNKKATKKAKKPERDAVPKEAPKDEPKEAPKEEPKAEAPKEAPKEEPKNVEETVEEKPRPRPAPRTVELPKRNVQPQRPAEAPKDEPKEAPKEEPKAEPKAEAPKEAPKEEPKAAQKPPAKSMDDFMKKLMSSENANRVKREAPKAEEHTAVVERETPAPVTTVDEIPAEPVEPVVEPEPAIVDEVVVSEEPVEEPEPAAAESAVAEEVVAIVDEEPAAEPDGPIEYEVEPEAIVEEPIEDGHEGSEPEVQEAAEIQVDEEPIAEVISESEEVVDEDPVIADESPYELVEEPAEPIGPEAQAEVEAEEPVEEPEIVTEEESVPEIVEEPETEEAEPQPDWSMVSHDASQVEEPAEEPDVQEEPVIEEPEVVIDETEPQEEPVEIEEPVESIEPEVQAEEIVEGIVEEPEVVTEAEPAEPVSEAVEPEYAVAEPEPQAEEPAAEPEAPEASEAEPEIIIEEAPSEPVPEEPAAEIKVDEPAVPAESEDEVLGEDIYTDYSPEAVVRRAAWNKGLRCRRGYGEFNIPVAFVKGKVAVYVDSDEPDTTHDAALREMGWTILRYDASTVTDGKAQGDEIAAAVKANMRSAKAAAKKKSKK